MAGFEGSEITESIESREISAKEAGGNASDETKEAAREEAAKCGGFGEFEVFTGYDEKMLCEPVNRGYGSFADMNNEADSRISGRETFAPDSEGEELSDIEDEQTVEIKDDRKELTEECNEKYNEIVKEAYRNSSAVEIVIKKDYAYKELSPDEKEWLSAKGKELINLIPKEKRGDFRVPEPEKIREISKKKENICIEENWKSDGGRFGTRHMEVPREGETIDRIGSHFGKYFAAMGEDGNPISLKARAIGDYLPEDDIVENSSYHAYEIQKDFTKNNFYKAVEQRYAGTIEYGDKISILDEYYKDCASAVSCNCGHLGEKYASTVDSADGVKTAVIDSMFTNDDGGGKQYITPFDASTLEELGMIREKGG